ncbi:hypothetical protein M569_04742, partial [Genlisea aurea]
HSPPPYYRDCWHEVSRGFINQFIIKEIDCKNFTAHYIHIIHSTLPDQALTHCPVFPTAASLRNSGLVAVPMWLYIFSN